MDTSPQSASSSSDETRSALLAQSYGDIQAGEIEEEEEHIHLPNPSYWPILLGISIAAVAIIILFLPSFIWVAIVPTILVLVCIMGWALEDPMAPMKEEYITIKVDPSPYKIGQDVVDSQRRWLGQVRARFPHYILVERGRFVPKVFYVPKSAIREQAKDHTLFLTLSEEDLTRRELNRLPDDLYEDVPEPGVPVVRGAAQFARRPLSPAETGHYNYGRRWPGINTDATGSYHREEVLPRPQTYVTEDVFSTDVPIPARNISPD